MGTGINYPYHLYSFKTKMKTEVYISEHIQGLYAENYTMLLKEIKDVNKWREVPYSFTGRLNREKMSFLPKLIYQCNEIPTKI